ncbi:hypothetical protein AB5J72_41665 [Streptomyces sp. CG1]|uniref:hypothetical protein n=1 Tax=Streptomyces sp. CG1 TaxID=1287523 RepID=UPI0034E22332
MADVDLRGVLAEVDVPDEVEPVLDAPLRPGQPAEALGPCLWGGQVRDRVDGLAGAPAGREVGAVTQDADRLDGVGEVPAEAS